MSDTEQFPPALAPPPEEGYYWIKRKGVAPLEWEVALWTDDGGPGMWFFCEASELAYGGMELIDELGPRIKPPSEGE